MHPNFRDVPRAGILVRQNTPAIEGAYINLGWIRKTSGFGHHLEHRLGELLRQADLVEWTSPSKSFNKLLARPAGQPRRTFQHQLDTLQPSLMPNAGGAHDR